ncbi:MAG: cobalamin B12-binding domain-containing protein [Deltaproteobacteria bacterium]|nr:cobalamin B12-binding domain-containing protein [Deltaproteobacteria bacterium]MBI3293290.1 cobalamin B12-binding domain-containing protein [Deltaproteobacteria bacterium]
MNIDERNLLPYGDTTNDGYVQFSFTLPIEPSPRAREAAAMLVRSWGFHDVRVAQHSLVGSNYCFFVVFARAEKGIDFTRVEAPALTLEKRSYKEIDKSILKDVGRPIRVVGACTGFDAHTVGLDAIMNMKGFDGDIGLERYRGFRCVNMGSQVPADVLIDRALKEKADAILLSKIITQKDIHISDMRELLDKLRARGLEKRFILVVGGPRVTHKMALEMGFDAGFTIGTRPSDVANFLLEKMLDKDKK